jgi:hypothetical protein
LTMFIRSKEIMRIEICGKGGGEDEPRQVECIETKDTIKSDESISGQELF